MPHAKVTLELELNIEVQQREGYFAARTDPFAITAYGKTEEEAEKRAVLLLQSLLEQYSKTLQEMFAYLNKRHAKHSVAVEVEGTIPRQWQITRECKRELKVEVPAGV